MTQDVNTNSIETPSETLVPRYEQTKLAVQEYIRSHRLKPGDRLPTETELCRQFGWSRPTIGRALNELAMEGVLTRVQGSGTYVAEKKLPARPLRIMICDVAPLPENEYNGPIFAGIRDIAAQEGIDIAYFRDARVPTAEALAKSDADGVLLLAPQLDDTAEILKIRETGKPVIAMAFRSRLPGIASVGTDNLAGMRQAVTYLAGLGHRKIGLITPGLTSSDVQERILGFHEGCFQAGIAVDPANLLLARRIDPHVLETWLANFNAASCAHPTAIICNCSLAFPILSLLASRGLRIPQDVSLVVTDDSDFFQNCTPQLTVIRQPLVEMGRRSLTKLLAMLRGDDAGEPEVIPCELIVRQSCSPIA